MFNAKKIKEFTDCISTLEDLDKPITYYNLRNLKNPLSNDLIKECLDFCIGFGLLHKHEVEVNGRFQIRYSKTILWVLLENFLEGDVF
jgi:hypothetical protein